jgi:hypothetical protein
MTHSRSVKVIVTGGNRQAATRPGADWDHRGLVARLAGLLAGTHDPVPLMLDSLVDEVFAFSDDRRGLVSDE